MQESLRDLEAQQFARQKKAEQRAKEARDSQQRRLREQGKESSLDYGQKLFSICLESLAEDYSETFQAFLLDNRKARPYASALPFFNDFSGTPHIAAVALTAAIDQISKRQRLPTFLQHLGRAVERECRLIKLNSVRPMEMRRLVRTMKRHTISSKDIMRKMQCPVVEWNDQTRLQVGMFLADGIFRTELLTTITIRQGHRTPRLVVPTLQAEEFIKSCKPRVYTASHQAMLIPPRDWQGLHGGGLLDNEEPIVKPVLYDASEKGALAHYEATDMTMQVNVINFLQRQRLRCSGEMVATQRITWEGGWEGLWPCQRNPPELPDRLSGNPSSEEVKARNRRAAAAHNNRERNRHRRLKIERSLQFSEENADRDLWQSWYYCWRGRVYANAAVSSQGSGFERAQLSFAEPLPVNKEAFEWLLKAAAGHWGLSRCTWAERLNWGKQHLDQMLAAAEDPLAKPELWRGAKDPWEFLQLCYGLREAKATGKTGVPIRLDQTTSGCGILAALLREETVGRLTNIYGGSPQDLYTVIAEAVTGELTKHLQTGDQRERAMAELWLERGIDRGLVKGPVLRAPMGGSYMSLCDGLVDALESHLGYVDLQDYIYKISIPSKYLASIMWSELKAVVNPVMTIKPWLKQCCKKLMLKQIPMEWTTPSGWPMRIADRQPVSRQVHTHLFGRKVSMSIEDQPVESPLSYNQANKAIAANALHGWDAAFAQTIIYRALEQSIPMLPTHDCFAVHPANAEWLHRTLHWEFGQMYRRPVLEVMHSELQDRTGIQLPAPPVINSLDPMALGSNPYLFS